MGDSDPNPLPQFKLSPHSDASFHDFIQLERIGEGVEYSVSGKYLLGIDLQS